MTTVKPDPGDKSIIQLSLGKNLRATPVVFDNQCFVPEDGHPNDAGNQCISTAQDPSPPRK